MPNSSQLTAHASRKLGALLPLDVHHTTSGGARWGFEAEGVKLAWSTGIRKHISAQRRQGSGAGTWLVGGFEFGYLLQCGGGSAGREACNVPLGWTTGSSSLLAGVLLRLGRIAAQDFEGSSSSQSQSRHIRVRVVDPIWVGHKRAYAYPVIISSVAPSCAAPDRTARANTSILSSGVKTRCQSVSGRPRTAARASETPWAGRPSWARHFLAQC